MQTLFAYDQIFLSSVFFSPIVILLYPIDSVLLSHLSPPTADWLSSGNFYGGARDKLFPVGIPVHVSSQL